MGCKDTEKQMSQQAMQLETDIRTFLFQNNKETL